MRDKSSFRMRSGEQMSVAIAAEAQRIVRDAARPIEPGEGVKAQLRRAWSALGRPPYWRVRAAWYGESGSWSAQAFEDLRARYRNWEGRQEARGRAEADTARQRLVALREALAQGDPDFHRDTIDALERALRGMGREVCPVARPGEE